MDETNSKTNWSEIYRQGIQLLVELDRTDPSGFMVLADETAKFVCEHFFTHTVELLAEQRLDDSGFEDRLFDRWGKALGLFNIVLHVAQEAGESKNRRLRPRAAAMNDAVFDVLIRMQARACRTSSEVFALLRTGHASGAHARWRTLHELAVVAYFINQNGQGIAERYLLHNVVESYKAALVHEKYHERLGYEPLRDGELARLRQQRDELVGRFGKSFLADYGWAHDVFGKKPTFSDLEAAVNLSDWRPYYKLASHGVHANAKGVLWNLGTLGAEEVMLAGPSNAGLADPGHGALISLQQVTTTVLSSDPEFEDVVVMRVMDELIDLAGEAFLEAHQKLERDEQTRRRDDDE